LINASAAEPGNCKTHGLEIVTDPAKLDFRFRALLTAGLLQPYRTDSKLQDDKRTQLDRFYQKVGRDLDELLLAVSLKAA
jgi:hypothetical protein